MDKGAPFPISFCHWLSFVSFMVALISGVMGSQNILFCTFLMARLGQIKNIGTEQFTEYVLTIYIFFFWKLSVQTISYYCLQLLSFFPSGGGNFPVFSCYKPHIYYIYYIFAQNYIFMFYYIFYKNFKHSCYLICEFLSIYHMLLEFFFRNFVLMPIS